MNDFYSTTQPAPARKFILAQSPGVDAAGTAIIVACLPGIPGRAVLEEALREADSYRSGTHTVALHVVGYPSDAAAAPVAGELADTDPISARLHGTGFEYRVYRAGPEPVDQVLELAESTNAALLAISVRRRSPLMKIFLGSVAQQLILEAPCPVLTVKESARAGLGPDERGAPA